MANKRRTPPPFLKGRKIQDATRCRQWSYALGEGLISMGFDLYDEQNVNLIKSVHGEGALNAARAIKG